MSTAYGDEFHIRWLLRSDMDVVVGIESGLPDPLEKSEIIDMLRKRNTIGMVVDIDGGVVGYILYEVLPRELHISHLAVHEAERRLGFGTAMVSKVLGKTCKGRRETVTAHVPDGQFGAMAFFRSLGFMITSSLGDRYEMTFNKSKRLRVDLKNRIRG
jgi:ribosomal protein S18 acetylase RimI-like enzyme